MKLNVGHHSAEEPGKGLREIWGRATVPAMTNTKTNPKGELLKELRTTDEVQIKGHLCTSKGKCAEGVICDLYSRLTGRGEWKEWSADDERFGWGPPESSVYRFSLHDGSLGDYIYTSTAPPVVLGYFGLSPQTIWRLNDDEGLSFAQIADWLEEHDY